MRATLFFHPEGFSTQTPRLMGRNAAGESFLKGFLAYSTAPDVSALVDVAEHGDAFRAAVAQSGRAGDVHVFDRAATARLAETGTLYHPGPDILDHAQRRSLYRDTAWSLCGITHTTSSAGAMDAITGLIAGPVQPWDALICTSTAVKANVEHLLAREAERLFRRLGATRTVLPRLPVIPLGIDTTALTPPPGARPAARAALGVPDDAVVVLFMGRLSFHAKAHPLALYQALEEAALSAGVPVVLIECGWFANDWIAESFAEAAAAACPRVRVIRLDGRKADARQQAWAAADVFASLSDNIQESFGLTPIEAMAAGLPVVVSDWDGYRDTVRDGIDGFRIPTLMPTPGLGQDLAVRHALGLDRYDLYCGYASALVSVDVVATAQAFHALFTNPDLRRRMGEAGQARARQVYDWSAIIPRYEALWRELAEIRDAQHHVTPPAQAGTSWPARPDPFTAFAAYPTRHLRPDTLLALTDGDVPCAQARLTAALALKMVNVAEPILPTRAELDAMLAQGGAGPLPVAQWVAPLPPERRGRAARALVWLVKLGIMRLQEPAASATGE